MKAFKTTRRLSIAPDTTLLCATILIAPELFGGAFPWTVVVIAGLSLACLGTALWVRRSSAAPVVDGVFIVMGVAWLWTCLQIVPLPRAIASALGLGSVQNVERLRDLDWSDTIPFTISYDPGSTHLQVLIGVAIVAGFLAARLRGPSGLKPIAMATEQQLPSEKDISRPGSGNISQPGSGPNILWLCTDQQRFDTIGALGNPLINTPNLDRLAADANEEGRPGERNEQPRE